MKKVAIIHYGLGNIQSVYNALEFVGSNPFIAKSPGDLKFCDCAILPGVGAFGDGMAYLNDNGWTPAIRDFALSEKKPFLGVCLGMQLLATSGTEHGNFPGLDLIKGTVIRLSSPDPLIRVPHIGWNEVAAKNSKKMYAGIDPPRDFYFVHSYVLQPDNDAVVSGTCHHGQDFIASVEKDNIWGAQFHPEKSQRAGLALLKNFLLLEV